MLPALIRQPNQPPVVVLNYYSAMVSQAAQQSNIHSYPSPRCLRYTRTNRNSS